MRAVSPSDAETAGCIISSKSAGANIATSLEPIMRSNLSATDEFGVGATSNGWIAWLSLGAIDATDTSWESTDMEAPFPMFDLLVPGGTKRYSGVRLHQKNVRVK